MTQISMKQYENQITTLKNIQQNRRLINKKGPRCAALASDVDYACFTIGAEKGR